MHQENRRAWNEGAARYDEQFAASVARLQAGHALYPPEVRFLGDLRSWCRRAIHLQCAGGEDTLSLWKLGAGEVVGVDISDTMIDIARRKAAALGASARWFQSDILETPHELDGWAHVVARLLAPGGRFYLFEGHPITWIFEQEAATLTLDPRYGDYFSERAEPDQGWPETYIGALSRPKEELAVKWERQWPLGTVMNALLAAGLRVERFEEHPDRYWEQFPNIPGGILSKFPHTYSLLMRK